MNKLHEALNYISVVNGRNATDNKFLKMAEKAIQDFLRSESGMNLKAQDFYDGAG